MPVLAVEAPVKMEAPVVQIPATIKVRAGRLLTRKKPLAAVAARHTRCLTATALTASYRPVLTRACQPQAVGLIIQATLEEPPAEGLAVAAVAPVQLAPALIIQTVVMALLLSMFTAQR